MCYYVFTGGEAMILNNYIIKQDLLEIEKNKKNKSFIILYAIIIVLLIVFSQVAIKEFVFLDLLAGIFCKISIFIFLLLLIESFVLSIKKYKAIDTCIQENLWKVEEHNLTSKRIEHGKHICTFTGNYDYKVSENFYKQTKIGERFYVVLKDKPCGRLIKYKKKVLNVYHKEQYKKYDNLPILIEPIAQEKITNKYIEKILFNYNLPENIEMCLISGTVSFIITTIFQVLKQQYFTYFSDFVSIMFLIIVFIVSFFILFSKKKGNLKHISLKNCVLVEEKNNYSLLGKNKGEYVLIKILPKSKYLDFCDNINKKREI